jgi:Transposase Tn5 dimerisation domain/Transposase DNA-binding
MHQLKANSMGMGTAVDFFKKEFEELDLKDKRLVKRAIGIFTALQSRLTTCVRRLFSQAQEMRQAYDFFSNPKVSSDALLKAHYEKTIERVQAAKAEYILVIQDGMVLNYTSHKAKTEIGRIGRNGNKDQYGVIQHSSLVVTDQNEPLGLIDIQFFDNDDFDVEILRDKRCVEEKKSICWVNALRHTKEKLQGITQVPIITVCDRESDFFELFQEFKDPEDLFVIRAQHNRKMGKGEEKLFEQLKAENDCGAVTVTIQDVNSREIKEMELKIKRLKEVEIPIPKKVKCRQKMGAPTIRINIVMLYNAEHCWILLTNLPVESTQDCKKIGEIYKARWHIEDYHKILKTGYQVDELYLHSSQQAIETALTMASISACRLYWLIYMGRVEKNLKADELFAEYEWKAVYVYFQEKIPQDPPPLNEVILRIAKLGGYKAKKNSSPPGVKTLWIGFQHFCVAANMYHSVLAMKT